MRNGWATGRGFPILHRIFQVGIVIKGMNAVAELASGCFLLFIPFERLKSSLNLIAGSVGGSWLRRNWALIVSRLDHMMAPDTKAFFTWFFLSHGAVKAFIIICLLRGWMWAYPLGIGVFLAFIAYQVVQIVGAHHSGLYLALTILDVFVVYLTVNEWRHARKGSS